MNFKNFLISLTFLLFTVFNTEAQPIISYNESNGKLTVSVDFSQYFDVNQYTQCLWNQCYPNFPYSCDQDCRNSSYYKDRIVVYLHQLFAWPGQNPCNGKRISFYRLVLTPSSSQRVITVTPTLQEWWTESFIRIAFKAESSIGSVCISDPH